MTSKPAMFAQEKWPFYQLLDQHRLLKIQSERYHLGSIETSSSKKRKKIKIALPNTKATHTNKIYTKDGSLSLLFFFYAQISHKQKTKIDVQGLDTEWKIEPSTTNCNLKWQGNL